MTTFDPGPLKVIPNIMPKKNKIIKTVLDSVFILSKHLIEKHKTQHFTYFSHYCDKNNPTKALED